MAGGLDLTQRAEATEAGERGETYEALAETLFNEVLTESREKIHYWSRFPDGREQWEREPDNGSETFADPDAIPRIKALLASGANEVAFLHTHPVEGDIRSHIPDIAEQDRALQLTRAGLATEHSHPPSMTDLAAAMSIADEFKQDRPERIRMHVADMAGIWEIAPDMKSPYVEKFATARRMGSALSTELFAQSEVQTLIRDNRWAEVDPRILYGYIRAYRELPAEQGALSPRSRELIQQLEHIQSGLRSDERIRTLEKLELGNFPISAVERTAWQNAYRAIGADLRFTPYSVIRSRSRKSQQAP